MKLPITLWYNDFIDLVDTMFLSNWNLIVDTNFWKIESYDWYAFFDSKYMDHKPDITINSIKISMPSFSIWDTVMIVDTGEIGEIKSIAPWWNIILMWSIFWKEPSKLVKIDLSLLPLLKDNE